MTARIVIAELAHPASQGRTGEGLWSLWLQAEGRIVEVQTIAIGTTPGEPWLAACADYELKRRIGAAGATVGHALAEIEDAIAGWRAGTMPRMAVTGDSRELPPAIELRQLDRSTPPVATSPAAAPGLDRSEPTAASPGALSAAIEGGPGAATVTPGGEPAAMAVVSLAVYGCKSVGEAEARALIVGELEALRPTRLWHGGGKRGTDAAALEWSARALVSAVSTPADWQRHGTRCGDIRGRNVARWCGVALVVWDPCAPEPDDTLGGIVREAIELRRRLIVLVTAIDHTLERRIDTAQPGGAAAALELLAAPRRPRPRARKT